MPFLLMPFLLMPFGSIDFPFLRNTTIQPLARLQDPSHSQAGFSLPRNLGVGLPTSRFSRGKNKSPSPTKSASISLNILSRANSDPLGRYRIGATVTGHQPGIRTIPGLSSKPYTLSSRVLQHYENIWRSLHLPDNPQQSIGPIPLQFPERLKERKKERKSCFTVLSTYLPTYLPTSRARCILLISLKTALLCSVAFGISTEKYIRS